MKIESDEVEIKAAGDGFHEIHLKGEVARGIVVRIPTPTWRALNEMDVMYDRSKPHKIGAVVVEIQRVNTDER